MCQTSLEMLGHPAKWRRAGQSLGPCLWLNLFCNHHVIFSHLKAYFFSYLLRCCMRTYDAWFPRYALRNRLMFFCRLLSPAMGPGSSALSTSLAAHKGLKNVKTLCCLLTKGLPNVKHVSCI